MQKDFKISGPLKQYLDQAGPKSEKEVMITLELAYNDYQFFLNENGSEDTAQIFFTNIEAKLSKLIKNYQCEALISCHRGCFHCCHYQVEITFEEAVLLAKLINNGKVEVNMELLREQAKIPDELWYDYPEEIRKCIFVGSGGECRVYENRPLACRKHNVVSDSAFCKGKPGPLIDGIAFSEIEAFVSGVISASSASGYIPKMLNKVLMSFEN